MNPESNNISSSSAEEVSTSNNAQANVVSSNTQQQPQGPTSTSSVQPQVANHPSSLFGVIRGKVVQPFKTRTKLINNPGLVPPILPVIPVSTFPKGPPVSKFKYVKPGLDKTKVQNTAATLVNKKLPSDENQPKSAEVNTSAANNVTKPPPKPLSELGKYRRGGGEISMEIK
ncbi:uncharacterized protein LOC113470173 [Diaphorina citri]|uniref:Uncharacterized protein LOC113470173 n=1 Tax=Diaphorina citri TaxID=121845 RepID=A0A3Q0JBW0_DIACI|nr:uncharacterized protein LOC113470173 [Diaphorina citri]